MRKIRKRKPWSKGRGFPRKVVVAGREAPSIGAIARGTGLDPAHVSRITRGLRTPSLQSATALAAFFGVSLDSLAEYLAELRRPAA